MNALAVSLPWICRDRGRLYVRRRGYARKIRLHAQPGTQAFLSEYQAAVDALERERRPAAAAPAIAATLRWLVERYQEAAEFTRLSESTQRVRGAILERACQSEGDKPYADLLPRHIRVRRDRMADRPEAANGYVKALRQLYAWAVEASHAERNPARDVPYISTGSDGFHSWTVAEVARFEERHPLGTKPRLALAILLYAGVRRSDAVRLGRQHEVPGQDGQTWLEWIETKGRRRKRKVRAIPILPQLREAIDACPSGHMTYLVTELGKPYTAAGFGNWFRRACDAASLSGCSAHGLRKAGAAMAAENGATEHQLMAVYGWETSKEATRYTRAASRRKMAGQAMGLVVRK